MPDEKNTCVLVNEAAEIATFYMNALCGDFGELSGFVDIAEKTAAPPLPFSGNLGREIEDRVMRLLAPMLFPTPTHAPRMPPRQKIDRAFEIWRELEPIEKLVEHLTRRRARLVEELAQLKPEAIVTNWSVACDVTMAPSSECEPPRDVEVWDEILSGVGPGEGIDVGSVAEALDRTEDQVEEALQALAELSLVEACESGWTLAVAPADPPPRKAVTAADRILALLRDEPGHDWTGRMIAASVKASYSYVMGRLQSLEAAGQIEHVDRGAGRAYTWRVR